MSDLRLHFLVPFLLLFSFNFFLLSLLSLSSLFSLSLLSFSLFFLLISFSLRFLCFFDFFEMGLGYPFIRGASEEEEGGRGFERLRA